MSIAGELKPSPVKGDGSRWHLFFGNLREGFALIGRPPRPTPTLPAWRSSTHLLLGALLVGAILASSMVLLDAPTIVAVGGLPQWLVSVFDRLTDFGTSDWFLVPIGVALLLLAALASPGLPHVSRLVLVTLMVRLGFIFSAIALPGLFVTIVKRLIGRARPFVGGTANPFHYAPFSWNPDYASLPSGHSTNVFAALVAIGVVWPRLRAVMFIYALTIAASRVIVLAHHPSDVIAGSVAGAVGALLVRDWFAARRLGFAIQSNGAVITLPGPSFKRLKAVARQLLLPRFRRS